MCVIFLFYTDIFFGNENYTFGKKSLYKMIVDIYFWVYMFSEKVSLLTGLTTVIS